MDSGDALLSPEHGQVVHLHCVGRSGRSGVSQVLLVVQSFLGGGDGRCMGFPFDLSQNPLGSLGDGTLGDELGLFGRLLGFLGSGRSIAAPQFGNCRRFASLRHHGERILQGVFRLLGRQPRQDQGLIALHLMLIHRGLFHRRGCPGQVLVCNGLHRLVQRDHIRGSCCRGEQQPDHKKTTHRPLSRSGWPPPAARLRLRQWLPHFP
mmetsp:Transcript_35683/g.75632  ORF Transcript_35683/g.75632 Transcript_35683/m.75632 type:complete len:207 (+) Transcript_35683:415-1035(+)